MHAIRAELLRHAITFRLRLYLLLILVDAAKRNREIDSSQQQRIGAQDKPIQAPHIHSDNDQTYS